METICGIDEAGKGPLLGPLVICGVIIHPQDVQKLVDIGVKDSKHLTPKKREELFPKIKTIIKDYMITIVEPREIDRAVESETLNLNWMEAIKTAIIVNYLKPDKAIIDCPSTNIKAYTDYIKNFLKQDTELQLEHNAERFPVVAAASILAKVTRDSEIEKLKLKYGDFGSGYPSDKKAQDFLKENWKNYPELFRQSWASYKKVANQTKLGEFK